METEQAIRTLEELLNRVDKKGLKKLLPEEVGALGRLYRRAAGILARTRTRGKDGADVDRLNRVVARAYSLISNDRHLRHARRNLLEQFRPFSTHPILKQRKSREGRC